MKHKSLIYLGGLLAISVALLAFPMAFASGEKKAKEEVSVKGQRAVFAWTHEYDNLDPHLTHDIARLPIRINMYDSLLRWEDNPPKLIPWLAEEYKLSEDGLKVIFKVRKGAKFHDGSEVTAEAVQYSMDRLLALGRGAASLFRQVIKKGTTRIMDKYNVEFNLTKQFCPFLSIIPDLYIVNPKICKAHEVDNDWGSKWLIGHEAGSGSYKLIDHDPAVGFTMARFEDHFLGWKGKHLDVVEFRTIRELSSRLLAIRKGEIHGSLGTDMPSEQIDKLRKDPNVKVVYDEQMKVFYIHMNNQRPPFNDVHIRRAISYAFDYDGYIKDVMGGKVTRNPGPIPNNLWGAPEDLKGYEYNLEKAKEEIALAKVKIDRPLQMSLVANTPVQKAAALILQNGLSQLGIKLNITEETWPVLTGKCKKAETTPDMWAVWCGTYYPDPDNWIGLMYRSAAHGTWKASSWYTNPKVDEMLNRALENCNFDERRKLYEEASRLIVEDAPTIFIFNFDFYAPVRKNVRGIRFCPVSRANEVRWLYLEE